MVATSSSRLGRVLWLHLFTGRGPIHLRSHIRNQDASGQALHCLVQGPPAHAAPYSCTS
jgi:hypothetical protein